MYIKQHEIKPIAAKDYLLTNWDKYDLTDTKEEFLALLNILQACGESIDSLHDAEDEFCDIYHGRGWSSDREVVAPLLEFNSFYKEEDFVNLILEKREDYENISRYVEDMRLEATDDINGNNDVQISKTDDGYVKRVWY